MGILLRISRELDVVGDVTAIVDNPSELLAWANTLSDPEITAWRAADSGNRYVQVSAPHAHEPVRGQVTAVLHCDQHMELWHELATARDLEAGGRAQVTLRELSRAWAAMPVAPPA